MIAAVDSPALWSATRGTGAAALLLLTGSVVLGVVHAARWRPPGGGRLLVETAHRTTSLLVLALLTVHVATSVLDNFAPIRLLDVVVPFGSAYRPLWVGFGAVALDLLLALTITSLLRRRLGFRAWRAVHWLAYACWPVAVAHGLGSGSDARATWMLALTLGCVAAVLVAAGARLAGTGPGHRALRGGAAAGLAAAALALAIWLPQGPLAHGWARRAGTPPQLLASAAAPPPIARPADPPQGFSASLAGAEREGLTADGGAVVDLLLRLAPGPGTLRVRLGGEALAGGGVSLRTSAVTLVRGATYQGRIERLDGTTLESLVGAPDGRALRLRVDLGGQGANMSGSVTARPAIG
ncbi:MAG TPA: ferric reductase-like transmembrane domain-containing protein [Conexibacter sp.]|jgi:sulfoxide reductase heme-binding subunit YedZ|nr:ferric reductase-like transmembrane domain-containing protein [Conexibacter sp.]